jgi:hypothetical protein
MRRLTYCFDIDGTICSTDGSNYSEALPIGARIEFVNSLLEDGHDVIYFSARGTTTGIDHMELTRTQLEAWGARYTSLYLGKPRADVYIDDRAVADSDFFRDGLGPQHR